MRTIPVPMKLRSNLLSQPRGRFLAPKAGKKVKRNKQLFDKEKLAEQVPTQFKAFSFTTQKPRPRMNELEKPFRKKSNPKFEKKQEKSMSRCRV